MSTLILLVSWEGMLAENLRWKLCIPSICEDDCMESISVIVATTKVTN